MKRRIVLPLLITALAAAGCGEKETGPATAGAPPQQRLTLMLDYFPNADHAGIYAAQATGDLRRAGIELSIQTPSDPSAPLKLLAAGKVDLAISYEPELLLARDKGLKLVSVGALVQKPLTSIMSLGSAKIDSPADLAGKTVGTAGLPYQAAYLQTILEEAGVDPGGVDVVDVGFNLTPAMLSKKVDATLGSFWNYEGIQLQRAGRKPKIIRLDEVGVPTYQELIVVAREQDLRSGGAIVRRFMQALARGHRALREDPDRGVDALLKANRDLERGHQLAVVKATLPVFFHPDEDKPFGWQEPREWRAFGEWMLERKLIDRPIDPTALTNEFLPGEGI